MYVYIYIYIYMTPEGRIYMIIYYMIIILYIVACPSYVSYYIMIYYSREVRPISELTSWISEGLTQT